MQWQAAYVIVVETQHIDAMKYRHSRRNIRLKIRNLEYSQ
jgi:hypothetical protein